MIMKEIVGKILAFCVLVVVLVAISFIMADFRVLGGANYEPGFEQIDFRNNKGETAKSTVVTGINNSSTIVGYFTFGKVGDEGYHGFIRENGLFRQIDFGGTDTFLFGINDAGTMVGSYGPVTASHSFLLDNRGNFIQIDKDFPTAAISNIAYGITEDNRIVGSYIDNAGGFHGFLYILENGQFMPIDYPDEPNTLAFGINESGAIVGEVLDQNKVLLYGFLKDASGFSKKEYSEADRSSATGINDRGVIVGEYGLPGVPVAMSFLNQNSDYTPIVIPNAIAVHAAGINNLGQRVGSFNESNEVAHGFYITPVIALGFNEGSGTTTADASGNGNTGTLEGGVTWTTVGKYGNALSFDGSSGAVRIPDSPSWKIDGLTGYTVSMWIKLKDANGDYLAVLGKGEWPTEDIFIYKYIDQWHFGIRTTGIWSCGGMTSAIPYLSTVDNTYHHIALSMDAAEGQCKFYSDGQVVATDEFVNGTTVFATGPGLNNLFIGGLDGGHYINADIDDLRVYPKSLTEKEIKIDMNTPIGSGSGDTITNVFTGRSKTTGATASWTKNKNSEMMTWWRTPFSLLRPSPGVRPLP